MRRMLAVLCLVGTVVPVAAAGGAAAAAPLAPVGVAQAPPTFTAGGSVEQVWTTGHEPGAPVALLDAAGAVVEEGVADAAGALLFREVDPGAGYAVRAGAEQAGDLTVAAPDDHPDDAHYAEQAAADPLEAGYGYLPTRDGTTLSVNVTLPLDGSTGPWPVVVNYSGYDPSQPGLPPRESLVFAAQGYVVVGVNMRGTGCSGGAFDFMETLQSLDGYDVVESLAHQPWSNGDVGMVGISYSGYSQLYVAATRPPHLDAITPLSPYSDTYSGILYPGGILNDGFAYEWASEREANARPLARGWAGDRVAAGDTTCADNQALRLQSKPLLEQIRATPFADHDLDHLNTETFVDRIEVPTFLSSQWQDEQTGGSAANLVPLFDPDTKVFANLTNGTHVEPMSPSEVAEVMAFVDLYVGHRVPRINPLLQAIVPGVLADLFQAGDRDADFVLPASDWDTTGTHAAALARYEARPRVRIRWETGSIPGREGLPLSPVTTRHADWPVAGTRAAAHHLQPDGALRPAPSRVADTAARAASAYTYDPATKRSRTSSSGTDSQWAPHPDVRWDPLAEGHSASFLSAPYEAEVAYAGAGSADLWVRSSAADTDLEVTLTEVRPDGQEVYIQSGWLRASHRTLDPDRSTELVPYHDHQEAGASPLPAGEFTPVRVELFPFAHVIRAGSRLRVNVEAPGGNQPFWAFDALPGTATNEIGHSVGRPSRVVVPELPAAASPDVAEAPPACALPGVTTQSVSSRNQPCRPYRPARVATGVHATPYRDGLTVRWDPPAGAAPTRFRVVPSLGHGAPAGARAPAPVEVAGTESSARLAAPPGVPLEVRVVAVYADGAGPPSSASPPAVAPPSALRLFGSWEAFARRQLTDLTGIVRADWLRNDVARLEAGLSPEDHVVSIRRGRDARAHVDPIARLYLAYLERPPTPAGLEPWVAKARAGLSLDAISQRFATTPEFVRRHGRLSNQEFAELTLRNTGKPVEEREVAYLTSQLDLGELTRGEVMVRASESTAFRASSAHWVHTAVLWNALLRRAPTGDEHRATVARLAAGTPLTDVVAEILASPAYARRVAVPRPR